MGSGHEQYTAYGENSQRKKNTKLRHAYIIIIIGYLTTGHSTKECVTPFFSFFFVTG